MNGSGCTMHPLFYDNADIASCCSSRMVNQARLIEACRRGVHIHAAEEKAINKQMSHA